jgi:hypothetical protein
LATEILTIMAALQITAQDTHEYRGPNACAGCNLSKNLTRTWHACRCKHSADFTTEHKQSSAQKESPKDVEKPNFGENKP